ncbi:MAG: arsenosugar biosynthesis radical SAM (seleno)protein ArsS [Acidiferrobacterales bacterium]
MHAMLHRLEVSDFPPITRARLETLQVNLGYRCNQACLHCHVNASPQRKEVMTRKTIDDVIAFLRHGRVKNLDLTGGAPELNPHFRHLVETASEMGLHVIDRCNLTILEEQGQDDLADFLAKNRVEIVASLPCYLEENVARQRGQGVFAPSIRALQRLNALGYGAPESGLVLNLVFNPHGPVLPPPQAALEEAYRRELKSHRGIIFNRLYTITNMPIQRFGSTLVSQGQFRAYMKLLHASHRDENLEKVMCRSLISVDWLGYVYDCDFNQMLGLGIGAGPVPRTHLADLLRCDLEGQPISVADHCYGCTAGSGSSCGGALDR